MPTMSSAVYYTIVGYNVSCMSPKSFFLMIVKRHFRVNYLLHVIKSFFFLLHESNSHITIIIIACD